LAAGGSAADAGGRINGAGIGVYDLRAFDFVQLCLRLGCILLSGGFICSYSPLFLNRALPAEKKKILRQQYRLTTRI